MDARASQPPCVGRLPCSDISMPRWEPLPAPSVRHGPSHRRASKGGAAHPGSWGSHAWRDRPARRRAETASPAGLRRGSASRRSCRNRHRASSAAPGVTAPIDERARGQRASKPSARSAGDLVRSLHAGLRRTTPRRSGLLALRISGARLARARPPPRASRPIDAPVDGSAPAACKSGGAAVISRTGARSSFRACSERRRVSASLACSGRSPAVSGTGCGVARRLIWQRNR